MGQHAAGRRLLQGWCVFVIRKGLFVGRQTFGTLYVSHAKYIIWQLIITPTNKAHTLLEMKM